MKLKPPIGGAKSQS